MLMGQALEQQQMLVDLRVVLGPFLNIVISE
jgi:hypothetical protein